MKQAKTFRLSEQTIERLEHAAFLVYQVQRQSKNPPRRPPTMDRVINAIAHAYAQSIVPTIYDTAEPEEQDVEQEDNDSYTRETNISGHRMR